MCKLPTLGKIKPQGIALFYYLLLGTFFNGTALRSKSDTAFKASKYLLFR